MNRILSLLATVFILASTSFATAQELPQFIARIEVSVSADEDIKGIVTSYIIRELRGLRDVELVDSDPEWKLHIVAGELSEKGGYKIGVMLSVVILRKFSNWFLLDLVPASSKETVDKLTGDLYYDPDHWVQTGSREDLRRFCNEIVADFDTKHLEHSRKLHGRFMDVLRKSKQSEESKP